jgi:hypothetical protein
MRALLEARNRSLLRDLEQLGASLASSGIPGELEPYRTRLLTVCDTFRKQCERNVEDLDRARDEILEDVLSNTQQATQAVRLLSAKLATPVLRASSEDRLCLKTISWLHLCHGVTASLPAAFTDGECAIWPFLGARILFSVGRTTWSLISAALFSRVRTSSLCVSQAGDGRFGP